MLRRQRGHRALPVVLAWRAGRELRNEEEIEAVLAHSQAASLGLDTS